jgi:hypothetical protein
MRICFRARLLWPSLLSLLAGAVFPPVGASAGTMTATFVGQVSNLGTSPAPPTGMIDGDAVNASFDYLTTQPPTTAGGSIYDFTTTSAYLKFTVPYTNSSGSETFTDFYTAGTLQIAMAKLGSGSTMTISAAAANTYDGGNISLTLTSASYNSTALPTNTTQFGTFVTTTNKPMLYYDNFSFDSTLTVVSYSGPNITAVPEPSSLVLSMIAMASGTGVLMVSRLKARGFSHRSASPLSP